MAGRRRARLRPAVAGALVAAAWLAAAAAAARAEAPAPLIVGGDVPGFGVEVLGRLQGDRFRPLVVRSPPAYDPATKRLYHISLARRQLETIDLSDPVRPARTGGIADRDGRFGIATAVVFVADVLAVSGMPVEHDRAGQVFFLDPAGGEVAPPVTVGRRPWVMAATPDRRRLVVVNSGEADGSGRDPEGSVSVVTLGRDPSGRLLPSVLTLDFSAWAGARDRLVADGVRLADPRAPVAVQLEPQGVAIAADGRRAWVTLQRNNALALVDLDPPRIAAIRGLGTCDHRRPGSGFDPSDQDGGIAIRPWPVDGLRQPDGIAAWSEAGVTWLITADEGDPLEDNTDAARVADLALDPAAYPDPTVKAEAALGRLRASRLDGDHDGDGDIDRLHAFGCRSFTVMTADGTPVFPSGDALERLIERALPPLFNAAEDGNRLDDRSDDRGPEPEQVVVGRLGGRPFAFLTLERTGGVVVYELSDPARPRFAGYVNGRNPGIDPAVACRRGLPLGDACRAAGDLGPETLLLIPEDARSTLLVVTHKASDSLAIYRFRLDSGG